MDREEEKKIFVAFFIITCVTRKKKKKRNKLQYCMRPNKKIYICRAFVGQEELNNLAWTAVASILFSFSNKVVSGMFPYLFH